MGDIIPEKRCKKCGEVKSVDCFPRRSSGAHQPWCFPCTKSYMHDRYFRIKNGIPKPEPSSKRCESCHTYKGFDQFPPYDLAVDGLYSLCYQCLDAPAPEIMSSHKRCTMCHLWLPFSDFYTHKTSRDGLAWWCKKCHYANAKGKRDGRKAKSSNLRNNYGITFEQYEQMFEQQSGVCAACGNPETHRSMNGTVRSLCVDHDHGTGDVRSLLCHECNTAYGLLREDESRILALLAYHRKHQKS